MPRVINANALRWLAEEADGKREGDYVVAWVKDQGSDIERLALVKPTLNPGDRVIPEAGSPANMKRVTTLVSKVDIPVKTPLEGEHGMKGDAVIQLVHNGKTIVLNGADCVFITQSAFNKFVIPYYTRFKSPAQIAKMRSKYYELDNIAVGHYPPSDPEGVDDCDFDTPLGVVKPLRATQDPALGTSV